MDKNEQLEKIHGLELEIAKEIKRICQIHNIPYFLTAGTLLGAVRHGGFIPWDDDMDIGMLREDYERFLEACKTELGERFFLQTWDTVPDYPMPFGKICLNGTHFREEFSGDAKIHDGIFVDVFPYDNVPDDEKERKKQARRCRICKRLLWVKKGMGKRLRKGPLREKINYWGPWLLAQILPYEAVKNYFKRILVKYNGQETQKVVTCGSYPYQKESLERDWVTHLEQIPFETEMFLGYRDREAYLVYFYGDYRKLPPEEDRDRHHRVNVDFGPY